MRFAVLGSGSEGNALVVEVNQTRVLLDCGFSLTETVFRLERLGLQAGQLHGIVVTHEHGDHISGVARLARKFEIPVWMTHGTLRTQNAAFAGVCVTEINPHRQFNIGDVQVQPYPVPHDAAEPVQFVFSDGERRLGVLTDTGCITAHIETVLNGCHALVLEFNHDAQMLADGDYHFRLKQRVGGRYGHLSNTDAAGFLARLDKSLLQHIVAAHLSQKNNTVGLVIEALVNASGRTPDRIAVASQQLGLDWCEIA